MLLSVRLLANDVVMVWSCGRAIFFRGDNPPPLFAIDTAVLRNPVRSVVRIGATL